MNLITSNGNCKPNGKHANKQHIKINNENQILSKNESKQQNHTNWVELKKIFTEIK